jgi:hypothetical protein
MTTDTARHEQSFPDEEQRRQQFTSAATSDPIRLV